MASDWPSSIACTPWRVDLAGGDRVSPVGNKLALLIAPMFATASAFSVS
jgi:hypothetical protein